MTEPSKSIPEIQKLLGPSLEQVGLVPIQGFPDTAAFGCRRFEQVLFMVGLGLDEHANVLVGSYLVEPLPAPSRITIAEPFRPEQGGRFQRRVVWPLADLLEIGPEISRIADKGLSRLRDRFDGAGKFAAEVDGEYLADDWFELAEAVAYLWFVDGDVSRASTELHELAHRHEIAPEQERRTRLMSIMVREDPAGARRIIDAWRDEHLRYYGLA